MRATKGGRDEAESKGKALGLFAGLVALVDFSLDEEWVKENRNVPIVPFKYQVSAERQPCHVTDSEELQRGWCAVAFIHSSQPKCES